MARPADDARHAEATFTDGALGVFERRHAAVRPGEYFRAVVRAEDHDGVVCFADVIQVLQQRADAVIHLLHARLLQAIVGLGCSALSCTSWRGTSRRACACVVPDEERFVVLLGLVHEVTRSLDQNGVECRHVVLRFPRWEVVHVGHVGHVRKRRQWAFIHDFLLADLAPARHVGGIVRVRRPAMHETARAVLVVKRLVVRERVPIRVRHCVEVIEVTEELIEAVHRRQELVQIAEVVFAELPGRVALRLERGGEGTGLAQACRHPRPAWPTVVRPVRMGISPVMKFARPAVQLASA